MDSPSDQQRPGRPRSSRSRDATLAAARALLLEKGYTRLTIDEVAVRAGVSKATIYRWWSGKGALALDAAGDDIAIGTVPDTGATRGDLDAAIGQLIDTFTKPLASIVIFAAITTAEADPEMAAQFRDRYVYPWRISATEALQRGLARGDLRVTDIALALDIITGTIFQRTLIQRVPDTSRLKESLLDVILI